MTTPIRSILQNNAGPPNLGGCGIGTILQVALPCLGHKLPESGSKSWLMSAYNGQVIFRKLFDDLEVSKIGLLKLWCIPGSLTWKNEQYRTVVKGTTDMEREPDEANTKSSTQQSASPIISPRDDYPGFKIEWQVRVLEKGLVVSATAPQLTFRPHRNPMNAIVTATGSLFVKYAHDRIAALDPDNSNSLALKKTPLIPQLASWSQTLSWRLL